VREVHRFVIAGKAACSDAQIQDRLSKGFRDLEIITFRSEFDIDSAQHLRNLVKYGDLVNFGSIHAPGDLTIAHIDRAHRELAQSCVERIIRVAPEVECERVVVHGSFYLTDVENRGKTFSLQKKAFQRCVESLQRLARLAGNLGVKICLENINAVYVLTSPTS